MRINNITSKDASQVELNQASATRDASTADSKGSTTGAGLGLDSIALSGVSSLVPLVLNAGNDVRSQRVAELKAQYESNTYNIDPVAVSRALISEHLTD